LTTQLLNNQVLTVSRFRESFIISLVLFFLIVIVTNFIQSYLYQFFDDSYSINGSQKPLKKPFDRYQSCLEAINSG